MKKPIMKQKFVPGEEWLYCKIYCSPNTAEIILTNQIKKITSDLLKKEIISEWFFIRYSDPEFHLRIRFLLIEKSNISLILNDLYNKLEYYIEEDIIWKIQIDTYERELKRYGKNNILLSESIFFYDSDLILNFLTENKEENENNRLKFALLIVDNYLSSFKLTIIQKKDFIENIRNSFANEFSIDKYLSKQLDIKFRKYKVDIFNYFINLNVDSNDDLKKIKDFNSKTILLFEEILSKKKNNKLDVNFNMLLSSLIHMSMVRLFKSKNRLHELVIYDFLLKYYKSCIARNIVL